MASENFLQVSPLELKFRCDLCGRRSLLERQGRAWPPATNWTVTARPPPPGAAVTRRLQV